MDDAEYLFKQDCIKKKTIAHSANKKVRHAGCKLPSDFMTRREKKELNGEVHIMNIHKPIEFHAFKAMSKDLQQEYLDWLVDTFGVPGAIIARELFKIYHTTLYKYIRENNLKNPFSRSYNGTRRQYNRDGWKKFLYGENDICETNSGSDGSEEHVEEMTKKRWNDMSEKDKIKLVEQAREGLVEFEKLVVSNNLAPDGYEPKTCDEIVLEQPFVVDGLSFNLKNIRDWESVINAISSFPLPEHNYVTITVHDLDDDGGLRRSFK